MIGNQLGLYHKPIMQSAGLRLRQRGYGLIYVSGGPLKPSRDTDENAVVVRNQMYPLARNYDVSGFILIASTVSHYADAASTAHWVDQFAHKPLVCIGPVTSKVAAVHVDDYASMSSLVEHMTLDPKRRRFVFIRGYAESIETQAREQAFRDVLEKRGIEVDESLIIEGQYFESAAYIAMVALLQKTSDIDAVVACSDEMAHGAVHALSNNGFVVPRDVLVSGFDDARAASNSLPPLTTVRYSMKDLVATAVDNLMLQISADGASVPAPPPIATSVVVRASSDIALLSEHRNSASLAKEVFDAARFSRQLVDNLGTITTPPGLSSTDVVSDIVSMLVNGSNEDHSGLYVALATLHRRPQDIYWWRHLHQQISDALKYQSNLGLSATALGSAVSILGQIHMTIWHAEAAQTAASRVLQEAIYQTRAAFSSASTLAELHQVLDDCATRYLVPVGYVCLYEHAGGYPAENARVFYNTPNSAVVFDTERLFSSKEVLPDGYLHTEFNGPLVLEPLCVGSTHLGYVVVDVTGNGYPEELNMAALANQIAATFWRCLIDG